MVKHILEITYLWVVIFFKEMDLVAVAEMGNQ